MFYVYALLREDGAPFYIGMGHADRWTQHERWAKRGRSHKDNVICKMRDAGIPVGRAKIAEGLTRQQARILEVAAIRTIGREPLGPLVNLTAGGDGAPDLPPEVRARIAAKVAEKNRGRKLSPEHVAKLRGRPMSPEMREKLRIANAARKASPETRARISAAQRGMRRIFTEGHRAALAAAARRRWLRDPEQLRSASKMQTPETKERARIKNRLAHLGRRASDESRMKRSVSGKLAWIKRRAANE